MSNTPHTLGEEFPGQLDAIHALKASDDHFARILEEYDEVNDRIHRAETRIEPISDDAEAALRKQRLRLKDEIAAALGRAAAR
ncbi:MAG: YdcH family protein [Rhizobiales bacterium]|nr:YdcH family protein [Hyphomicrobiales bacterium]